MSNIQEFSENSCTIAKIAKQNNINNYDVAACPAYGSTNCSISYSDKDNETPCGYSEIIVKDILGIEKAKCDTVGCACCVCD